MEDKVINVDASQLEQALENAPQLRQGIKIIPLLFSKDIAESHAAISDRGTLIRLEYTGKNEGLKDVTGIFVRDKEGSLGFDNPDVFLVKGTRSKGENKLEKIDDKQLINITSCFVEDPEDLLKVALDSTKLTELLNDPSKWQDIASMEVAEKTMISEDVEKKAEQLNALKIEFNALDKEAKLAGAMILGPKKKGFDDILQENKLEVGKITGEWWGEENEGIRGIIEAKYNKVRGERLAREEKVAVEEQTIFTDDSKQEEPVKQTSKPQKQSEGFWSSVGTFFSKIFRGENPFAEATFFTPEAETKNSAPGSVSPSSKSPEVEKKMEKHDYQLENRAIAGKRSALLKEIKTLQTTLDTVNACDSLGSKIAVELGIENAREEQPQSVLEAQEAQKSQQASGKNSNITPNVKEESIKLGEAARGRGASVAKDQTQTHPVNTPRNVPDPKMKIE